MPGTGITWTVAAGQMRKHVCIAKTDSTYRALHLQVGLVVRGLVGRGRRRQWW